MCLVYDFSLNDLLAPSKYVFLQAAASTFLFSSITTDYKLGQHAFYFNIDECCINDVTCDK